VRENPISGDRSEEKSEGKRERAKRKSVTIELAKPRGRGVKKREDGEG